MRHGVRSVLLVFLTLGLAFALLPSSAPSASAQSGQEFAVVNWEFFELVGQPQPACGDVAYSRGATQPIKRRDCGFGRVYLEPAVAGVPLTVEVLHPDTGEVVETFTGLETNANGRSSSFRIEATPSWGAGLVTFRATVDDPNSGTGEAQLLLNPLDVTVNPDGTVFAPGEDITVDGLIREWDLSDCCTNLYTPVPSDFTATLETVDGEILATQDGTANGTDGSYSVTFPGAATQGLTAGPETDYEIELAVRIDAHHYDETPYVGTDAQAYESADWVGAGSAAVTLRTPPDGLLLETSFVSSTGWVKPGDTYPFRVIVRNLTDQAFSGASVAIEPPPDLVDPTVTFTDVTTLAGSGTASIEPDGSIGWSIGDTAPATDAGPTVATLVVEARAEDLTQDPEIVWKDLSATATLTWDGGGPLASETHGPKVVPPDGRFDTARYGDKPFPVVPVDYLDREHEDAHSGDVLARVINSPNHEGSTFNLYQEMSFGQLYPEGVVPSAGIATADFDYEPGFGFSTTDRTRTCRGVNVADGGSAGFGTPLYPERISGGWYQLPGDTEYYGGDYPAFSGSHAVSDIDSACGPTAKSVHDAAVIADPEIDYNDFDSDKDGVVDFFMMVFVGIGGNGASQTSVPAYDNIWPHSSSLEFTYTDEETGLKGYVSDDQLHSLEEIPQCWTDENRTTFDNCEANGGTGDDALPVPVRVGPYNVNPEDAIERASVISHEYGHHLGLPDFYSTYQAYNDWNLMAADYSQHMTIFSKQDLGWVVPDVLQPGDTVEVEDWEEIKNDTGTIRWQRPDGTMYTLSEIDGDQNIHNGHAYTAKLPQERIIDPAKVEEQASAPWLYHSGSGNDFGCTPDAGHNLDIRLPELADLEPGDPVTLSFRSSWDIEWDWDYGFVMVTTGGASYESLPSENGYTTTNDYNPNNQGCFTQHDNGITGQSGTYEQGTQEIERLNPGYGDGSPFLTDEYDLSEYAGEENVVLRFSYFTDAGFARPGWFIDDLSVTSGEQVLYESDFTEDDELRTYPGGCRDDRRTAANCTAGFSRLRSDAPAPFDHAYYLELRDRSGFDLNGRGQSDRGDIGWSPGVLIEYTNEVHGLGNSGYPQPPNQHYLDSQPQPGLDCGGGVIDSDDNPLPPMRCQDAAFTAAEGDAHFDDDPDDEDGDWIDNFDDPSSEDGLWHFAHGCLSLDVTAMSGNTNNSEALPSDLTADAVITAGDGCRIFRYHAADDPQPIGAPTARAQAKPLETQTGEPVTFDASLSSDPDGDDLTYTWDFDASDGIQQDATGETVTHSYDEPGEYTATLTVDDGNGGTDADTVVVRITGDTTPENRPPQASADATERVVLGDGASFDARGSSDPDGDALDYRWTFGDGETASGAVVTHTYETPGHKTAMVTVRDGRGGRDTSRASVQAVEVRRYDGKDRIDTAIQVARDRFGAADEVVLATSHEYADALAGAPFAADRRAPILLNPPTHLDARVRQMIEDLQARRVHLLGGDAALSPEVEDELTSMGLEVDRFAGTDRFDTARLIAQALGGDEVYIVEGHDPDDLRGWPDAMIAAPVAAFTGRPVLLVVTDALPEPTRRALEELGVGSATIVGGPVAVSDDVEAQLERDGVDVTRIAGDDRFGTSKRMAERAQALGMDAEETWLARGDNWPDSLTGGAVIGETGGVLLLVTRADLDASPPTRDHLVQHVDELLLVRLLGGHVALTPELEEDVRRLIRTP